MGLLARLNLGAGNTGRALELYDRAFTLGSDLLFVKNDLAFLLASSGGDLDRALSLAQMAAKAPGENVSTVDTLGYVYLKLGKPDAAVWQFRQAVAESETPIPDYYYHLGLALVELEKTDQARAAIEEALALNPDFPDAPSARRLLSELGSADSGEKEPAS
jgi:tetratricopeptide (TPR) repeat protein